MKKATTLSLVISTLTILASLSTPAQARDTQYMLSIEEGMNTKSDVTLDDSVKFYFAGQKHPVVLKTFKTDVSNLKTNSFGKGDEVACNWAFLSTLLSFQKRAKELGANAVINLVSYYKKNEMASAAQFECHAGAIIAGVALKGEIVTVADK
jgi:hypothetical protein